MANYLRKENKKIKNGEWKVYNHYTHSYDIYTLDDLKLASSTLPMFCKDVLEADRALTSIEQRKLIQLADLSMQVWGGGPNKKLPWVHIDDYFNEFYITVCKYLTNHKRDMPGAWVARCKFMGFDTVNIYFKEVTKALKMTKALESMHEELMHLYPEAYSNSCKVNNVNPEM